MITTAVEMARQRGIDPQRFRKALRRRKADHPKEFEWHELGDKWTVEKPGDRYEEMLKVLDDL